MDLEFRLIFMLLVVIFISKYINAADHELMKNCSRVEICREFRNRQPEDKYTASLKIQTDEKITFTLTSNDGSNDLELNIFLLRNDTLRLIVNEIDSVRYQLEGVLDGELEIESFDNVEEEDDKITLIYGNNKIVVILSPFSIQIGNSDEEIMVFEGNRLYMEYSESRQALTFGVKFTSAIRSYGLQLHADNLALRTTTGDENEPYRLRNLDTGHYELNSPMALYGSVPVLFGHSPTVTSGTFLHNAAEVWVDISNNEDNVEAYFIVESGTLDLFIFLGPKPVDVVSQYLSLTGVPHLPQLWTLGYHQCRWNYNDQEDVKTVVANFNSHNFPLDAIWLDIEYTNGRRYFTWHPDKFSDPIEMQNNISVTNKKLVVISDPHIKVEEGYFVYDGALERDVFIKNSDNKTNFEGDCWPGQSSWLDYLNPAARDYYASLYSYEKFEGSTPTLGGIWNDMNEPAVFNSDKEKTIPNDVLHYGGVVHRDIHNVYSLFHVKATHQGLLERDNNEKRPFVLTRAHFAGSQRYAAIWTGDNTADYGYISAGISMCLTANILGFVICGSDVGGFYDDPSEELLERFYQANAWLPFYRAHATAETKRREPYLFSEEVQKVIRNAMQVRYKHLPVWYTLVYEHIRYKRPVIRPLFYQYPDDSKVVEIDKEFLVGTDILVHPIVEPNARSVSIYFPGGSNEYWVDIVNSYIYFGTGYQDITVSINSIPYFYRIGSIIVRKNTERLSTVDSQDDGYTLYVLLDKNEKAHGTVYIDDFTSFKYRDNDEYSYINIDADGNHVTFTPIDETADSSQFEFNVEEIIIINIFNSTIKDGDLVYKQTSYKKDDYEDIMKPISFIETDTIVFNLD